MCGRYYVDDDTAAEIERVLRRVDERLRGKCYPHDVYPGSAALLLKREGEGAALGGSIWGFPGFDGKKVIFNARSETAAEKKMFRESVLYRRCAVPASGFYEWNRAKDRYFFRPREGPGLLLAGFYKEFGDGERFVILTTQANTSLLPVHPRMPLLLEPEELQSWLGDETAAMELLRKTPGPLRGEAQGQISLFE